MSDYRCRKDHFFFILLSFASILLSGGVTVSTFINGDTIGGICLSACVFMLIGLLVAAVADYITTKKLIKRLVKEIVKGKLYTFRTVAFEVLPKYRYRIIGESDIYDEISSVFTVIRNRELEKELIYHV